MKHLLTRLPALALALGAVLALVAAAQAGASSRSAPGTLVGLRKTALGVILVDTRGRTLYLFEKDRAGVSMCGSACAKYWPALTSHGSPRAGNGVRQSLLKLGRTQSGRRQVTYAGHPLYLFVGDKRAGQTTGEGLDDFGAEWYALGANGAKVDHDKPASSNPSSGGGYSSSGYGS